MLRADWKRIVTKAWSVRLMVLAAVLSFLEIVLTATDVSFGLPPLTFAALSGFVSVGAFLARIYAQKEFKDAD